MIKAMLVDDEKPALRELEFLLARYPEISVIGIFKNPLEALLEIERLKPEVIFLDINMPAMTGTDAASRILDLSPDTEIVFVTAFDRYAIEAFELHALDYLLKPVEMERFEKTIERILKRKITGRQIGTQKFRIRCLGRFEVGWEGQEPIKWRTEKTKELFAYLLANTGRSLTKEELLDRLWEGDDPDRAIKQLYNGIYYIRKTLGSYGVDRSLVSIDNNYNLMLGEVDWDAGVFLRDSQIIRDISSERLADMEALYEGDYLEGEYYSWVESERERFLKLYEQCVFRLSEYHIQEKRYDKAEGLLLKAFNKNPYEEGITVLLLKLYRETGNKPNAARHFNMYSRLIQEELGIMPDERIKNLAGQ